jgi:hypothetical protein
MKGLAVLIFNESKSAKLKKNPVPTGKGKNECAEQLCGFFPQVIPNSFWKFLIRANLCG